MRAGGAVCTPRGSASGRLRVGVSARVPGPGHARRPSGARAEPAARAAAAEAARWFACEQRRLAALHSIVARGEMVESGDSGGDFRAPFFLLRVAVPRATHGCGPDCPCWEGAVRHVVQQPMEE